MKKAAIIGTTSLRKAANLLKMRLISFIFGATKRFGKKWAKVAFLLKKEYITFICGLIKG